MEVVAESGERSRDAESTEEEAVAADTPTRLSLEHQTGPSQRIAAPVAAVQEGDVLADRYRILRRLGKGGMGEVFLAEHLAIERKVAIKTLGANLHDKPELADRFLKEAKTSSRVRHPNIVDITDFGHTDRGAPFFVMEYLEGEDLKSVLRREGALPWPRVRAIGLQICAALAAAHAQGVVHRDMKPDNVFLVRQGDLEVVKVLDFGIAKIVGGDGSQETTQTGVLLGTPEYMSPEQAQDMPLDARSDIYATGVILYRLLTGRVPFQAKAFMTVLAKHINEPPLPPSKANPTRPITPAQEEVILTCLAKRPEDRYQSADALAAALRAADDPTAAAVRPPARPRPVALLAALAVAVAAGLAVFLAASPGPDPKASDPPDSPPIAAAPTAETPTAVEPAPKTSEPPPVEPDPKASEPPPAAPPPDRKASDPPAPAQPKTRPVGKSKPGPLGPGAKAAPVAALGDADLRAAAASVQGALKACGALGIPGTSVKVDVQVGVDGKVDQATAHKPIGGSALGICVEKAARGARFPALTSPQKATLALKL